MCVCFFMMLDVTRHMNDEILDSERLRERLRTSSVFSPKTNPFLVFLSSPKDWAARTSIMLARNVHLRLLAAALAAPLAAHLESGKPGSIAPVVKLLGDMKTEVEQETKQSRATYDKVEDECGLSQVEERKQIEMLSRQVEAEVAKQEEAAGAITQAAERIAAASGSLQKEETKKKAAKARFAEEKADFHAADTESAETISMVGHAIQALQRNKGKAALLQRSGGLNAAETAMSAIVQASSVSLRHKEVFRSLLQSGTWKGAEDEEPVLGQGAIVEMFEKFQADETAARNTRAQEWSEKKMRSQLLIQQLTNNIANFSSELEREKEKKAAAEESGGKADSARAGLEKSLADSKKTLEDSILECRQAKEDFHKAQEDFRQQLAAINKALEILQKAPDFVQIDSPDFSSFLQLGSKLHEKVSSTSTASLQTRAAILLQRLGTRLESFSLQQLAQRVEEDPFKKVNAMIESMIARLEKEQTNEASKKQYCDKESKKAGADVGRKQQEVDKLSARQDDAQAEVETLKKKNDELAARVAEISNDVKTQNAQRNAEKQDNLRLSITMSSTGTERILLKSTTHSRQGRVWGVVLVGREGSRSFWVLRGLRRGWNSASVCHL